MTSTDDLARLWQTEGGHDVAPMTPFRVNALVDVARVRHRRRFWPLVLSGLALVYATMNQAALLDTVLPKNLYFLVYSGDFVVVAALLAVLLAAVALHLGNTSLAIADALDDVTTRRLAPLLTTLRRWQWATAVLLLPLAHVALLGLALSPLLQNVTGIGPLAISAMAVVVGLVVTWFRLEQVAAPLRRVVPVATSRATAPSLALVPAAPQAPTSSAPASSVAAAPSSTSLASTSRMADVDVMAVPGSSAALMSSRHFRATTMGVLSDRERSSWRIMVGLVALGVVPLLFDALAVLGLQWGPQASAPGASPEVQLLHRVVPYLPVAISLVASLVTPMALLGTRDLVDDRFSRRFTWLTMAVLLSVPAAFSALGLMMGPENNAHLWSYSWSMGGLNTYLGDGCDSDCRYFFGVTSLALVGRVMRFGAVVVIAAGMRRLVGPGRLRSAIFGLLAGQGLAWIVTAMLQTPDPWRGLIDVSVAVGLLLIAVLSQPAFEEGR